MNALQILKNSGDYEEFSIIKLKRSLLKSGLTESRAEEIARRVRQKCTQGYSTKRLYRLAYNLLKKENRRLATNYSMTKAISELGPDGYHFEKFVCAIFKNQGYEASTNYYAEGKCVRHEIDVKALGTKSIFCECKFHNNPNTKNDLKTALYVKARADDIRENPANSLDEFWLVSNTKFSKDAIKYASCAGLILLGPNAPQKQALSELALKYKVFPISSLTTLKRKHCKSLINKDIIFADQILTDFSVLDTLGLSELQFSQIKKEIKGLYQK